MIKVAKIKLLIRVPEGLTFEDTKKVLWEIQRENRDIANRTVQYAWELLVGQTLYKKVNDEYLNSEQIKEGITEGLAPVSYFYRKISEEYTKGHSKNRSSLIRDVENRFRKDTKEYLAGRKSVMTFKRNMPIHIEKPCIKLIYDENADKWSCRLTLLSKSYKNELGLKDASIPFSMVIKDNSSRSILERCYDGVYDITASKLIYKDFSWHLQLGYEIPASKSNSSTELNKNNVCGVYIGEFNSVVCSNNVNKSSLFIAGGEIEDFRAQVEKKKRDISRGRANCGEGSIGHGRKTRLAPLDPLSDKISNFRKTTNHKYSKAIVAYAENNECSTIVFEDLTGVSEQNKMLKTWSYYDLQEKVRYKAKAKGINVIKKSLVSNEIICPECGAVFIKTGDDKKMECKECGAKLKEEKLMEYCFKCGEKSEQDVSDPQFRCPHCGLSIGKDKNKSLILALSQNEKKQKKK